MLLLLLKERLKEISNISYYFVFILCGEMAVFSPTTSKFEPKIVCLLKRQREYMPPTRYPGAGWISMQMENNKELEESSRSQEPSDLKSSIKIK